VTRGVDHQFGRPGRRDGGEKEQKRTSQDLAGVEQSASTRFP